MAKYGSDDLTIEIDNSGGTLVDMTSHITEINDVEKEAALEESTPFGAAWATSLASGVKLMAEIEITGFYDDTASTGPDVVIGGGLGDTRTVAVTWGSTKKTTVEAIIAKYTRIAKVKESTKYKATLQPTGAVTEA